MLFLGRCRNSLATAAAARDNPGTKTRIDCEGAFGQTDEYYGQDDRVEDGALGRLYVEELIAGMQGQVGEGALKADAQGQESQTCPELWELRHIIARGI